MGTYLRIRIKDYKKGMAKYANDLWAKEFPEDIEEGSFLENFYHGEQGPTLHFYTVEDLLMDASYFRDSQGLDVGMKTGCRTDLGFRSGMSDEEAIAQYKKIFVGNLGVCEIKLSGEHYCVHKLKGIKAFLGKYKDVFEYDDEGGSLKDYIENYPGTWMASAYCRKCKEAASSWGVTLPVNHGQGSKGSRRFIDARGKDVTEICSQFTGFNSFVKTAQ